MKCSKFWFSNTKSVYNFEDTSTLNLFCIQVTRAIFCRVPQTIFSTYLADHATIGTSEMNQCHFNGTDQCSGGMAGKKTLTIKINLIM